MTLTPFDRLIPSIPPEIWEIIWEYTKLANVEDRIKNLELCTPNTNNFIANQRKIFYSDYEKLHYSRCKNALWSTFFRQAYDESQLEKLINKRLILINKIRKLG